MDTLLINGGFDTARKGIPCLIEGREELEQQIMIRLRVRRGSFPYDKELGSRLYSMRLCPANGCEHLQTCADVMIREALRPIHGLFIVSTQARFNASGKLLVSVTAETNIYKITKEVQIWE